MPGFVRHAENGPPLPGAGGSVLAGVTETHGAFSLLISHAPAGDGAPLHQHTKESESFFVLEGTYEIECGGEGFEAGAHDFVYLPAGVPHSWRVVGETPGTTLILAVPGGIEAFFDDLAAGADAEDLTHRHGVEFLA